MPSVISPQRSATHYSILPRGAKFGASSKPRQPHHRASLGDGIETFFDIDHYPIRTSDIARRRGINGLWFPDRALDQIL